ncbi:MAG: pyrroline-5-carboxylate reductase [Candidatus Syntrophoarchaeum caldarius]|uniref:Pyrroline-5-carboxylate reductase n=1 Tax=Candidatus Syntropharchaeum caldarium TaxID=1838285 RepID=A0A1F2P9U0_9EURY|nr:MAG: pyrroline-5-carboxylate reductase [Candidatus Syntrophoarchaeum caldarius]
MPEKIHNLGFIGGGRIAGAIIQGVLRRGLLDPDDILVSDISRSRLDHLRSEFGVEVTDDNLTVPKERDILVIAVKPQMIEAVLTGILSEIAEGHLLISVAAGVKTSQIEAITENIPRVIRVMPNIAAIVGEAASAICKGSNSGDSDLEVAKMIFEAVGSVVIVDEASMDAVTGLSGSGPGFIMPIIEALADGGVHEGLDRNTALTLAAQTVLGAGKLVLESNAHPGALKDMVTSPGGTTITGLKALEEAGVRDAMMEAVIRATAKSRGLGD